MVVTIQYSGFNVFLVQVSCHAWWGQWVSSV